MTLSTSVPSNLRRPGAFHEFRNTQAGLGLVPLDSRVALVGIMSSTATATAASPFQIFDETDGDAKCGPGSQLAMMARAAFAQARLDGVQPEIWAVAIAAPGASVAAQETLTVTASSALAGNLVFSIAGRVLVAPVSAGDSATTIAAAMDAAIDAALLFLPLTSTASSGVVTCVVTSTGVWGNDIAYRTISAPSGVSVAYAASVTGTGTVDVTASVDTLIDKDYDAIVLGNHGTTDVTDMVAHNTTQWGYGQKLYRHAFIGERGSLATANTLGTTGNDKTVVIIACEGCPNLPGEIAAAGAVACIGKNRPNANLDGQVLALYPPLPTDAFTSAEVESALSSGVTPLTPTANGTGVKIERMVTTKTTLSGAPFEALRDIGLSRTDAYMARQIDIGYRLGFFQEVIDGAVDGELFKRIKDMVIRIQKAAEKAKILRNVDDYIDQILVEESEDVPGRILVQDPYRVAGALHQAAFLHVNYL